MSFFDRQGQICGFLNYEEKENSSRFTRRYFIISLHEHALLSYFDSPMNLPDGSTALMRISLSIISNARDVSKQRPKIEYCFVISTPVRDHFLQADTQEEKEAWILQVNNACKVTVPSKVPRLPVHGEQPEQDDEKEQSYRTEIVGGVVVRTPVNQPIGAAVTLPPHLSDSDSDEDINDKKDSCSSLPCSFKESRSNSLPSSSKYVMQGWCVKQGAVRKSWKRRYFALGEHGVSYFKSEQDKLPIRTIAIGEIIGCKVSGQWSALQRDNLFEINCHSRTFFVQANTPEEMEKWVNSINSKVPEGNKNRNGSTKYNVSDETDMQKKIPKQEDSEDTHL